MTNICHNAGVVYLHHYLRQYLRDAILGFCPAWQVALLLCPPLFVCTSTKWGSSFKMCTSQHCIMCFVWSVCVDRSTSFAFRCLCRLKSTSPSSLSFPESVQKSMCYEIKKLPSGLSFQIYILLVFKYIFATTLWGSQQQLQVSGPYWQYFLASSWVLLDQVPRLTWHR